MDPANADALDRYRGLIGNWVDSTTSPAHRVYEHWVAEGDTALSGYGHVVAGGDTVFIEELRLAKRGDRFAYCVRVPDQNDGSWVQFASEPMGTDTLMFENPLHDFPQCITYIRATDGTWSASVTGTENGTDREATYAFRPR